MMNKQKNPEAAVSAESVTGRKKTVFFPAVLPAFYRTYCISHTALLDLLYSFSECTLYSAEPGNPAAGPSESAGTDRKHNEGN